MERKWLREEQTVIQKSTKGQNEILSVEHQKGIKAKENIAMY